MGGIRGWRVRWDHCSGLVQSYSAWGETSGSRPAIDGSVRVRGQSRSGWDVRPVRWEDRSRMGQPHSVLDNHRERGKSQAGWVGTSEQGKTIPQWVGLVAGR
jgi:hypothetical protein